MKDIKLYVWENVLTDYTSGMVCILARDLEHAKEVFFEKYKDEDYTLEEFFGKPYRVITKPEAFRIWGGG